MRTKPVRHTPNAVVAAALAPLMLMIMSTLLAMMSLSGAYPSAMLLHFHVWGSLALTFALWLTFKMATRRASISDTGFELRGMFVDRFVPFHLVDFVTTTGGLALVLTDGGHRPIPGFDPSPYGEMRRYRLHHAPATLLQDELDRSRRRDVEGETHESTRFRPDLLVLVAALVLSFLSAPVIEYLFAS